MILNDFAHYNLQVNKVHNVYKKEKIMKSQSKFTLHSKSRQK